MSPKSINFFILNILLHFAPSNLEYFLRMTYLGIFSILLRESSHNLAQLQSREKELSPTLPFWYLSMEKKRDASSLQM